MVVRGGILVQLSRVAQTLVLQRGKRCQVPFLPVPEPQGYLQWLNASQPKEEIENIPYAIQRSRPYGSEEWVSSAVAQFGLENSLRRRGGPGKDTRQLFGVGTGVRRGGAGFSDEGGPQ
jgi:hypothetical protein